MVVRSTIDNNQYKEFEYGVAQMGSEIVVVNSVDREELLKGKIINDAKKQIEQLIYGFVCRLTSPAEDHEEAKKISYYRNLIG